MIITHKLTAIIIFFLINSLALAANIDFKTMNNSSSKNCTNDHTKENCTDVNGLDSDCQPDKSEHAAASNVASKYEQCTNVISEKSYVEPKFSTKRPRGQ